ncbi:flagellar hook assembly protein FlgD [Buchnera aphidicola]|uniref:Basal-body rod modification protein FlgD n=1 Tax=Buchnera aphidicola str. Ua (Uroleucon ambrosiae) TaxID=1005057 RepID=G2LPJ3_BUCUM|nr:flagellar hook capping FlgD N-terminal domain-containing protein [Buchnera aphidicola]AEO08130.1 basal-body rod modification protein FlgD [Buchnera aphidicola str. Ua (Uroleucon ambrosiae)]
MSTIHINQPINNHFIQPNHDFPKNSTDPSNPLNLQKNFLTLLITQIQNQDPTNPIKNTELTSQLAQINTANGIEKLNNAANKVSNQINSMTNIQLNSLIGHHVMTPSHQIIHTENIPTKFGIELISHATSIKINILDKNNKILYEKIIKDQEPGIYNFLWDGKDLNNNIMQTGKYYITATAKNNNQNVPVETLSESLVNSIITSSTNDSIIDLGPAGNIKLFDIREILT